MTLVTYGLRWIWGTGGILLKGRKEKYSEINLSKGHYVLHKSHTSWNVTYPRPHTSAVNGLRLSTFWFESSNSAPLSMKIRALPHRELVATASCSVSVVPFQIATQSVGTFMWTGRPQCQVPLRSIAVRCTGDAVILTTSRQRVFESPARHRLSWLSARNFLPHTS